MARRGADNVVIHRKRLCRATSLDISHLLDQRFHVAQIILESSAACRGQFVFSFRQPAFEELRDGDVSSIFEFTRMNAEITVSGIHQVFEIAERQRLVGGECANDPETQALVDQAVEIGSGTLCL